MTPLLLGDPAKLYARTGDNALDMTNVHNLSLAEVKKLPIDVGICLSKVKGIHPHVRKLIVIINNIKKTLPYYSIFQIRILSDLI